MIMVILTGTGRTMTGGRVKPREENTMSEPAVDTRSCLSADHRVDPSNLHLRGQQDTRFCSSSRTLGNLE